MSDSILGGQLSIRSQLTELCTLTKIENIIIPYNGSTVTVSVASSTQYIVLEFALLIANNTQAYGSSPSGYVSYAIIPYKSTVQTGLGFNLPNATAVSSVGIVPAWPSNTSMTLYHTYNNSGYTISARVGHFK